MGSKAFLTGLLEWRICVSKEVQFVGGESKEKRAKPVLLTLNAKGAQLKRCCHLFHVFLNT